MPKRSNQAREVRKYDPAAAESFWTNRLATSDPLAAVLTYDAPSEANEAYDLWERQSLQRLLERPLKHKLALDIGCGTGRISLTLARQGAHVTALDVSRAMLRFCRDQARKARIASQIRCIQACAHQIPCPDDQFDIITCFGVLEHLPVFIRRRCLDEAARLLRPRGKMYVIVNNKNNPLLTPRYRVKKTMPKGYFVSLVGLDWLMKTCRAKYLSAELRAANPCYALAQYGLMSGKGLSFLSGPQQRALFQLAVESDLRRPPFDPLSRSLASHFLIEITHKRTV
jgi:ubiquinone/menaquinone biosynthesis C-methylase UbiE